MCTLDIHGMCTHMYMYMYVCVLPVPVVLHTSNVDKHENKKLMRFVCVHTRVLLNYTVVLYKILTV